MRNKLPKRGAASALRVCVGFSGGLDSTVLLHLLAAERASTGMVLSAAHVHHGLNPQADAWARDCRAICRQLDVPFQLRRVRVSREPRTSLEEEARTARYAALAALPVEVIALAHHADDQAETLLLQLLRGAGPKGLAGMAALSTLAALKPLVGAGVGREAGKSAGQDAVIPMLLWRPLLDCNRAQLEAYAQQHQLVWIEDSSNLDVRFKRNFVRARVMPVLAEGFPAPVTTLARAARHQADAASLADAVADNDLSGVRRGAGLEIAPLLVLDNVRLKNLLRRWLAQHALRQPSEARLLALLRALRQSSNDTRLAWQHDGRVVRRTKGLLHCS